MTTAAAVREHPILFSGPMVRAILEGRKTQTRRVVTGRALEWLEPEMFSPAFVAAPGNHLSPFGYAGDLLWVRETFSKPYAGDDGYIFRADGPEYLSLSQQKHQWGAGAPWKPSIHMPKVAARIWLRVTDVSVERLREITNEDARAEGAQANPDGSRVTDRTAFAQLWDSLNERRGYGWGVNPWVWVVSFERTEAPAR